MTEEQRARLQYLREDLAVWAERRRRARWSLILDRIYNCKIMDQILDEMKRELDQLEELERQ